MFEEDDFGIIDRDSYLKDPPKLEDLSELATSAINSAKSKLPKTYDEEAIKEVLFDLMVAEKKCRQSLDADANKLLCCFILEALFNYGDLENVNYYLMLLSKKRGQLKGAVYGMVELSRGWLGRIEHMEKRLKLYETLNAITVGKIYLEDQRAELVFSLAKLKEEQGLLREAQSVLQDIEVETFGCLSKLEKVRYILEQMRVNLLNSDFIRFFITSKKINEKLLDGDDFAAAKLQYFEYMVEYYLHEKDLFQVAQSYYKRYQTLSKNEQEFKQDLEKMLVFLILSPMSESAEFMERVSTEDAKGLKQVPEVAELFRQFRSDFLIPFPLEPGLLAHLAALLAIPTISTDAEREDLMERVNDRVIEHNVQVVSKFYSRITLTRLSTLINTTVQKLEDKISNMVYQNDIYAKIDRLSGLVKFGRKKEPEVVLNNWLSNVGKLMELVDQCSRLVQKEKMIHEARAKQVELDSKFFS